MSFRTTVAIAVAGAVAAAAWVLRDSPLPRIEGCVATAAEFESSIDLEQAQWAALMAAIAERRGLPVRATTIAIATAFQESKIHNLDYGDRDSLGLFQQRPSQGWGTREQILDPAHAIGAFYDALVKVSGYETMEITDAAQRVQRSAFPTAYADHEPEARALASTLRGYSPAKFSCQFDPPDDGDPQAVLTAVDNAFGSRHGTVRGDRVDFAGLSDTTSGWALAHFLVANAARLHISSIEFDARRWTADDSPDGWQPARASADTVVATTG